MRKFGLTLIVFGVASFILPLLGIQLRVIQLFGGKPIVGAIFIGIGAVLFLVGWVVDSAKRQPQRAYQAPPQTPMGVPPPIPPMRGAAPSTPAGAVPPVSSYSAQQAYGQTCARCGNVEQASARFCGVCGAAMGANQPIQPSQRASGGGRVLVATGLVIFLLVGAIAVGCWYWLQRDPRDLARRYGATPTTPTTPTVVTPPPIENRVEKKLGLPLPKVESESASKYIGKARFLISQRNPEEAFAEVANGLAKFPNDAALLSERGNARVWLGDYEAALQDYMQAVRAQPNAIEPNCELIRLKMNFNSPVTALADAQQLAAKFPNDATVTETLAQAQLWNNDVAAAQQTFNRLLQLDSDAAQRVYDRGQEYLDAGVYIHANLDLCSAVWLDPTNAQAYLGLGRARVALDQRQRAIEAFERFLQLEPHAPDAEEVRLQLQALRQ